MTTPEDEAFEAQQAEAGWLAEWAGWTEAQREEYEQFLAELEQSWRNAR